MNIYNSVTFLILLLQLLTTVHRVNSSAKITTAYLAIRCVTCMMTAGMARMRRAVRNTRVKPGRSSVRMVNVSPLPGRVMAMMTVEMQVMRRSVVSRLESTLIQYVKFQNWILFPSDYHLLTINLSFFIPGLDICLCHFTKIFILYFLLSQCADISSWSSPYVPTMMPTLFFPSYLF